MLETSKHFCEVKTHSGAIGNESANALDFQAAEAPVISDISLYQTGDPFIHIYLPAAPLKKLVPPWQSSGTFQRKEKKRKTTYYAS
eukprot:1157088-Pelagomonas_calceolata.AAC.3